MLIVFNTVLPMYEIYNIYISHNLESSYRANHDSCKITYVSIDRELCE